MGALEVVSMGTFDFLFLFQLLESRHEELLRKKERKKENIRKINYEIPFEETKSTASFNVKL